MLAAPRGEITTGWSSTRGRPGLEGGGQHPVELSKAARTPPTTPRCVDEGGGHAARRSSVASRSTSSLSAPCGPGRSDTVRVWGRIACDGAFTWPRSSRISTAQQLTNTRSDCWSTSSRQCARGHPRPVTGAGVQQPERREAELIAGTGGAGRVPGSSPRGYPGSTRDDHARGQSLTEVRAANGDGDERAELSPSSYVRCDRSASSGVSPKSCGRTRAGLACRGYSRAGSHAGQASEIVLRFLPRL